MFRGDCSQMHILETSIHLLSRVGTDVFTAKMAVERSVWFSDDALHIFGGVLLQLAFAFVFRTSLGAMGPWLFVLALELINEVNDLSMGGWPNRADQLGESVKDILLTMALPTLLLIIARTRPRLLAKRA